MIGFVASPYSGLSKSMKAKKWLPLLGAVVFCSAAYLLYRALSQYDPAEIVASIFATSLPDLALGWDFNPSVQVAQSLRRGRSIV